MSVMMMIGRDEFVEQHATLGSMPQKFYNLQTQQNENEFVCRCLIMNKIKAYGNFLLNHCE